MGEISKIAWTDATFNSWWGCEKLSEACAHCYAERDAKRWSGNYWGKNAPRRFFGTKHWMQPYDWNRKAISSGKPMRVFSGSMCDVFEDRPDLIEPRQKLFNVIEDTNNLVWLLLTKRPENISRLMPNNWWDVENQPENVWFGVTVENQHHLIRLAVLEELQWSNIFVSVEPMLGPVDFGKYWHLPDWVIVGGESGIGARQMDLAWALRLKEKCEIQSIPFFMKQLGGYPDKRDDINLFPESLRVRNLPKFGDER